MILGQDKSLAIIEIGEKYYLISITAEKISLLNELEGDDLVEIQNTNEKKSFSGKNILDFKDLLRKNIKTKNKESEEVDKK